MSRNTDDHRGIEPRSNQESRRSSAALSASEIESLLNLSPPSRVLPPDPQSHEIEELGPGDIQYLQGTSIPLQPFSFEDLEAGFQKSSSVPEMHSNQFEADQSHVQSPNPVEFQPGVNLAANHARPGLTLEDLGNINLEISIELGRAEILIDDVLKLREGAVVTLDRLAGDPVDIVANGKLVARGELLVVDGQFGVRLSEVL